MTRSQAVALPPPPHNTQLEADVTSGTLSLEQLAEVADNALEAHNAVTRIRLITERQIAQQYLFNDAAYRENAPTLRAMGWTPHRITTARRAAQLTIPEIDAYIQAHTDSQKEATIAGARSLTPTTPTEERKGIAAPYTAPPIDIQIAREFGMETSDARAEILTNSIQRALETMPNPKHAYVWSKYIGIQNDGTLGDKWTFDGIAKNMPNGPVVTREYVEGLYYRASSHVFQTIAVDAWNQVALMMRAAQQH